MIHKSKERRKPKQIEEKDQSKEGRKTKKNDKVGRQGGGNIVKSI